MRLYYNCPSFAGKVPNGLIAHPDRRHILYTVGSMVVVEDISSNQQELLQGHTNYIKTISVSRDGTYIASGETTEIGLQVIFCNTDHTKLIVREISRLIVITHPLPLAP